MSVLFGLVCSINLMLLLCHSHRGVVAFVGEVHYAKGVYAGVVMDDRNVGKNNGEC